VQLRVKKCTAELIDCLGVVSVDEVVSRGLLRWYMHVERKDKCDWVSKLSRTVFETIRCLATLISGVLCLPRRFVAES